VRTKKDAISESLKKQKENTLKGENREGLDLENRIEKKNKQILGQIGWYERSWTHLVGVFLEFNKVCTGFEL